MRVWIKAVAKLKNEKEAAPSVSCKERENREVWDNNTHSLLSYGIGYRCGHTLSKLKWTLFVKEKEIEKDESCIYLKTM